MDNYLFDIHTHTIASGHGSSATITDMVKAAKDKNLSLLGISDHGPKTLGGGRPSYFRSLPFSIRKRMGIEMLYGAEVNILDEDGSLDLEDELLKNLDFVIASLHRPVFKPGSITENTSAYVNAMKNPYVNFIGHPDDTHFPVDYHVLVVEAMKNKVILEINNSSLSPEGYRGDTRFNDLMILNLLKHYHYPVLLSSDSHGSAHVGDFSYVNELLEKADFPNELILNNSVGELKRCISR
ncbi:putative hydrolase [Aequitasia blattaphilus]|uniref:Phosphatase n=1 Tax=Aequitasia blattaphilus TaxID=2949332 RepID=A0ABT1EBJ7_9FIRM|nr:phosphatase [Aequitasia blattaphilus]MCP1102216.1 phosphatase [Aequitasia blattaphilus]MCR8614856.1 phosphatase [Aequitasia blattaphilus]